MKTRQRDQRTSLVAPVVVAVSFALAGVWGCQNTADAQLTTGPRVETFSINPDSFVLDTETAPTITVDGDTTRYRIQSSGSLQFTPVGGGSETRQLEAGDEVIERPVAGIVTFFQAD